MHANMVVARSDYHLESEDSFVLDRMCSGGHATGMGGDGGVSVSGC